MMARLVEYLWLIPAAPLLAALAVLCIRNTRSNAAAAIAIGGQLVAFAMSVVAFASTLGGTGFSAIHNFTWFRFGDQALRIGWLLDPLTAAMVMMITFVALWIFVFSVGYMAEDRNFSRFFAYLSFFTAAMLGVVIANSLLLLFVCWELVGLASYLLIGFWIERPSAATAAKKAFITTRIGDIGFFLGLLWLYGKTGTTLFYDGGHGALEGATLAAIGGSATAIALLIFCGAAGKSGQFPLHVWLPDAMEGPTPVSALIHAATMVAAGVFLVARVFPIFSLGAVHGVTTSLTVVVWIGVITALMASLIAVAQFDIKRILAYSTVSQLGLMMVSLGVGGVAAGIMHLLAHGFFKALLFLGAGSVIHGNHHEQDIRKMGGLRGVMRTTFLTYAIGMMALSGVPLFFAGAWTKEEILHATAHWPASRLPYYLMMVGVVATAFYMTRQMIYLFFGERREASRRAHESPRVMTVPLVALAVCTIALSAILTPAWPWLHDYLSGSAAEVRPGELFQPMILVSLALVAIGVALGIAIYKRAAHQDPFAISQPIAFRFLENRMWLDELYAVTVIAASWFTALLADFFDRYFWDGLARLIAAVARICGSLTKGFDEGAIDGGIDAGTGIAQGIGRVGALAHNGQIQRYLGAIAAGMVALLLIYVWLT